MNINIDYKGSEIHRRGVTDISEPWNSKGQLDKYKTYGNFDCNDVYKYLKEKGEI